MLRIIINNRIALRLNQSLLGLDIQTLSITNLGGSKVASIEIVNKFADWMHDVVQMTRGTITYNGYIIDKSKVKRYEA